MYNLRWYIYYTVHTCDIVSFCFCKAVSFCIIIYKLNYSSVSNKMFCSPNLHDDTNRLLFHETSLFTRFYLHLSKNFCVLISRSCERAEGISSPSQRWLLRWPRELKTPCSKVHLNIPLWPVFNWFSHSKNTLNGPEADGLFSPRGESLDLWLPGLKPRPPSQLDQLNLS